MRCSGRWPVHPPPRDGEALSSWLRRVARRYAIDATELVHFESGETVAEADIDIERPAACLQALADRAGIDPDTLRGMTLAGWTPGLLDSLSPSPDAFSCYVQPWSVLAPSNKRPERTGMIWRAWIPPGWLSRACRTCVESESEPAYKLIGRLPLLLSCPVHGGWLDSYFLFYDRFIWDEETESRGAATEAVQKMDRRTWEAFSTGAVELPRRRIHAGLWFRLLRTLLDELSVTPWDYGVRQARAIKEIWARCGHPMRGGLNRWKVFEHAGWTVQARLLEGAATALDLIETGAIEGKGEQAALFLAEPPSEVPSGHFWERGSASGPLERVFVGIQQFIALAKRDPEAARCVFRWRVGGKEGRPIERECKAMMVEVGIPVEFLADSGDWAALPTRSGRTD
jgi:hypothetical protein